VIACDRDVTPTASSGRRDTVVAALAACASVLGLKDFAYEGVSPKDAALRVDRTTDDGGPSSDSSVRADGDARMLSTMDAR
jgi:hypothetical protein